MRKGSMIGLLVALGAVGAYGAISWVFADRLVGAQFPSTDEPVDFASLGLPEPEAVTVANGSTELVGWYFANPAAAGCAVIQLHGFGGDRAQVVGAAPLFWDLGCDILVYDLRGHGRSSPGLLTYGAHDKFDELAMVDWLANRTGLPLAKIGLMGWSYGAATSIQAAAERPGLAFVIADASYSSVSAIADFQAEQQYGVWARVFLPGALFISGLRAGFDPADASPEVAIAQVTDPVLLITSTTDEFTPYQHSEAIYANSDPSRTRLELTRWGAPARDVVPDRPDRLHADRRRLPGRLRARLRGGPGPAEHGHRHVRGGRWGALPGAPRDRATSSSMPSDCSTASRSPPSRSGRSSAAIPATTRRGRGTSTRSASRSRRSRSRSATASRPTSSRARSPRPSTAPGRPASSPSTRCHRRPEVSQGPIRPRCG